MTVQLTPDLPQRGDGWLIRGEPRTIAADIDTTAPLTLHLGGGRTSAPVLSLPPSRTDGDLTCWDLSVAQVDQITDGLASVRVWIAAGTTSVVAGQLTVARQGDSAPGGRTMLTADRIVVGPQGASVVSATTSPGGHLVFVLDTGALHAETLALLDQLAAQQARHPHAPLTVYRPVRESVVQFVAREGRDAMYKSIDLRKACCGVRKMEPLARALHGQAGWVTGLRREQSGARAEVPLIDRAEEESKRLLKYNPLADWTWGDVWHYIGRHQVPYNPLHDQFYPSIGCAPCTRAISLGEDFRAGRWWWEDEAAKECGLHVAAAAPTLPAKETA